MLVNWLIVINPVGGSLVHWTAVLPPADAWQTHTCILTNAATSAALIESDI
jgi:hypothetical protein